MKSASSKLAENVSTPAGPPQIEQQPKANWVILQNAPFYCFGSSEEVLFVATAEEWLSAGEKYVKEALAVYEDIKQLGGIEGCPFLPKDWSVTLTPRRGGIEISAMGMRTVIWPNESCVY